MSILSHPIIVLFQNLCPGSGKHRFIGTWGWEQGKKAFELRPLRSKSELSLGWEVPHDSHRSPLPQEWALRDGLVWSVIPDTFSETWPLSAPSLQNLALNSISQYTLANPALRPQLEADVSILTYAHVQGHIPTCPHKWTSTEAGGWVWREKERRWGGSAISNWPRDCGCCWSINILPSGVSRTRCTMIPVPSCKITDFWPPGLNWALWFWKKIPSQVIPSLCQEQALPKGRT